MTTPRLGLGLPVSGAWATPENMRHVAERAEELGYTSLWSFQRLLHPVDEDWGSVYHGVVDPVTALAYVAGFTSRIRLGLAVVNLPFYSPLVLSKALTTVDIVSAGRLDVGLGLGWAPQEFEAVGVPMEGRGARAEEFVACLKAIWTQPEVEFSGAYYRAAPQPSRPQAGSATPPAPAHGWHRRDGAASDRSDRRWMDQQQPHRPHRDRPVDRRRAGCRS